MYRKLSFRGFVHIYTSSRVGPPPKKSSPIGFWTKNPPPAGGCPPIWPPSLLSDLLKSILRVERMEKRTKNVFIWSFQNRRAWIQNNDRKKMPAHPSRAIIYLASHTPYQNLTRISPKFLGPSNILLDLLKSILRVERMEKRTGNVRIWSFVIRRVWKTKKCWKKVTTHCRWTPTHPKNEKKGIFTKINFLTKLKYLAPSRYHIWAC